MAHCLDTVIVFRIRHYWEIRKVVNGHKSAAHTDSPDGCTSKTWLGGSMNCHSDSSFFFINFVFNVAWWTLLQCCDTSGWVTGRALDP